MSDRKSCVVTIEILCGVLVHGISTKVGVAHIDVAVANAANTVVPNENLVNVAAAIVA
jgi:hypothetical protein